MANEGSRGMLEPLFESAPIGMAYIDAACRYVRVNPILAGQHGLAAEAMLGRTVEALIPQLWPEVRGLYARALSGERVLNEELSGVVGPTAERSWLVSLCPVRSEGRVVGLWLLVNDVTERRRAEQALRTRNDLYAMLSRTNRAVSRCRDKDELYRELCTIAVETGKFRFAWLGVPDGKVVRRVASAGDDGGYLAELEKHDLEVSLDERDPRSQGPTGRCVRQGRSFVVNDSMASELTSLWRALARRSGFRASAAFPLVEQGRVVSVLTLYATVPGFFTPDLVETLNELTPSVSFALDGFVREAQRQRDEAELRMRDRALSAASQGIVIADARLPNQPIVYTSPGFQRLTGYPPDEVLGRNCHFLQGHDTDPAAVDVLRKAIADGRPADVELLNYRKDGSPFWNAVALSPVPGPDGRPTHFVGVQTDVSARHELEGQLRQAQKMEAVGQLAAGIAHDFNNLLTVILGYSTLDIVDLAPGPLRDDLDQIIRAGRRASELTRQLLAFSRRQVLVPRVLDVGEVLLRLEKMLRRLLGESIELSLRVPASLGRVHADPGQVEQILSTRPTNRVAQALGNG
jgi:PAS domain S-box-containing protein